MECVNLKEELQAAKNNIFEISKELINKRNLKQKKLKAYDEESAEDAKKKEEGIKEKLKEAERKKNVEVGKKSNAKKVEEAKLTELKEELKNQNVDYVEIDILNKAKDKETEIENNLTTAQNDKKLWEDKKDQAIKDKSFYQNARKGVPGDEGMEECHSTPKQVQECQNRNSNRREINKQRQQQRTDYDNKINENINKENQAQEKINELTQNIENYEKALKTIKGLRQDVGDAQKTMNEAQAEIKKYNKQIEDFNNKLKQIEELKAISNEVNNIAIQLSEMEEETHLLENKTKVEEAFLLKEMRSDEKELTREDIMAIFFGELGDMEENELKEQIVITANNEDTTKITEDHTVFN